MPPRRATKSIACWVRSSSSTRFGRSVSASCVAWCASSASARADFSRARFAAFSSTARRVTTMIVTTDAAKITTTSFMLYPSDGPVAASTGGNSSAAASSRSRIGWIPGRARCWAGRAMVSAVGCAAASASIPKLTTYQGSTHCVKVSRLSRPPAFCARSAASIEREAGAEEPHGRAPSTGHEQQPEQRGNEDDVEQWVGREHRRAGRARRRR